MIIDAKRIWISGGYGKDNTLEASISFLKSYAMKKNIPTDVYDQVISLFFLELKEDEGKYRYKDDVCPCGCGINKSGTAAVHEIMRRLDEKALEVDEMRSVHLVNELNSKIVQYMKKDNEKYVKEFGPRPVRS